MLRATRRSTGIKVNRNFEAFFADRIVQACTQPTMLDAVEHLMRSMDVAQEYIGRNVFAQYMGEVSSDEAASLLVWMREHPKATAMIASLKEEADYEMALGAIKLAPVTTEASKPLPQRRFDIALKATLQAPLAHGGDDKAGNATLFRRRLAMTPDGKHLRYPYYAGNALRGQLRDLLADHFLQSLGLSTRRDKPAVNLWFFHALYAGGVLEEGSKATDAIDKELGKNGMSRAEGMRRLRDTLPALSLLGAAIGNKILEGRVNVSDLRPDCLEVSGTGKPMAELFSWEFLTRRDDYEGRGEDELHRGMIANTECLREGVVLRGGIDMSRHVQLLERGALDKGLDLLMLRGALGGENRRGLGKCAITCERPDDTNLSSSYEAYLADNKESILEFLLEVGAINARG